MNEVNSKTYLKNGKQNSSTEINLIPILMALLKKLWLIALVAVIFGAGTFAGTKLFITPTYRSSFTAYVNNKSQLHNGQDTVSSGDLSAAQQLVRAYSKTILSRRVLLSAAEAGGMNTSYAELANMVSTNVENETEIITVYVEAKSPDEAYTLAKAIADNSPNQISDIIEGSSMKIIDAPLRPTSIYKPGYVKNTGVGIILGALIAAAYIIIRFLLDDKVKNESELEGRFSLPVVGVIPDLNSTSKGNSNYYDYEYAYRYSDMKRSGGRNNG